MNTIWKTFLQILFPESCIGCGQSGISLCKKCLISIPAYESSKERALSSYIYPIFDFRIPLVRKIIWRFKYKNTKSIALLLADVLLENLNSLSADLYQTSGVRKIHLVPIPLDLNKLRARGYNQSEEIIKAIINIDTSSFYVPFYKLLCKKSTNTSQVKTKSKSQRLKNISGSLYIGTAQSPVGLDIILVDDVVTTGATLSEAHKVLLTNGARSVHAITIAH